MTVVIPAHVSPWIEEALDSVRRQTFQDIEIVVVDDGSPQPIAPLMQDDIVLVRQQQSGPGGARNRGIALARGQFVAFLDSDDRWRPDKLAQQVAYLDEHRDCVMSTANWCYFELHRDGRFTTRFNADTRPGDTISLERLFSENCICCSAVVVRHDVLRQTTGMTPHRRYGEDYALWLQIAAIGTIGYLDAVQVEKRVHPSSLVRETARDGSWFHEELSIYREFLAEHPQVIPRSCVDRTLGRLYFQRGYQHLSCGEWNSARAALLTSLRHDPRKAKPWIDLFRAALHV